MTTRNRPNRPRSRKPKSALSTSLANDNKIKPTGTHGWDPDHYDDKVRKVAFLTDEVLNYIYSRSTPEHKALIKILELANEAKHAGCLFLAPFVREVRFFSSTLVMGKAQRASSVTNWTKVGSSLDSMSGSVKDAQR